MNRALAPIGESRDLASYLAEINRFPLLGEQEEFDLAVRFREHNDLEAAHRLVSSYLRYVAKIAREYQGYYGLRMMDLIQEGSIGLMQAVKRFDPHKGFRLATYAMWWIRASIQEFVLKSWSLVKVGTTSAQRKLFFSLRRAKRNIERLDDEQAAEIGARLGVDKQAVLEMDGRLSGPDDTLNRPLGGDGEEMQNLLVDARPNQEVLLLAHEEAQLRDSAITQALTRLNDRERVILAARVMADDPATLETLAGQLGVSRERVRQIEKRALEKLRDHLQPPAA